MEVENGGVEDDFNLQVFFFTSMIMGRSTVYSPAYMYIIYMKNPVKLTVH